MTIARDTYIAAMLAVVDWQQVDVRDALDADATSSPRYPAIDLRAWLRASTRSCCRRSRTASTKPRRLARRTGAHVALVDGEMLSWYGSRAIAGLEYLREMLA